ncbi:MAG: PAS domain S-box protein [Deltaproteobacteria bacterium]|nr:MAG: PAS domain S-box protein [Deltaproteobacteria bacterium]
MDKSKSSPKLEETKAFVDSIIRSMFDSLVVVSDKGKITKVNQAALDLLGYSQEELIGRPVGLLFSHKKNGMTESTVKFVKLFKKGIIRDYQVNYYTKDGEAIPVSFDGSVMRDQEGKLIGIMSIARDLRESTLLQELEKTNQELIQASEKLRKMDKVKDELLSFVSHELRAPAGNILSFSEFLLDDDISSEEGKAFVENIKSESEWLLSLINNILDLSRMEAGKMKFKWVQSDIAEVINRSAANFLSKSENKGRNLKIKTHSGHRKIYFDPDRIQQVMLNILSNASKFSPENTAIEIETREDDENILISVRDQGVGIAPENIHKIFDKFERIEMDGNTPRGTGLGMPICKQIIEEGHHGKIWLESPGEGKGATFFFSLPKNLNEYQEKPPPSDYFILYDRESKIKDL